MEMANTDLQEMFVILLSSWSHYNANFKFDQSVFAIHDSPLYFEISEDDYPRTVNHNHPPAIIDEL
jgi:hypothetical protein